MSALGEFWKTYFGILAENFGEMLRTFLRYFEIILWNCLNIFAKSPENFKKMHEK